MKKLKSGTKKASILNAKDAQKIDALQVALLRIGHTSVLPELYEIFGMDKLLKFLDIFGGVTIEVPDRSILEKAVRDTFIFLSIDRAKDTEKSDVEKDLSDRYSISRQEVKKVYDDMQEFMV